MSFTSQTTRIVRVRVIPANKSKNGQATVILQREGYPDHDIVRGEKVFLTDLKNSFLIGDDVNSVNHPDVLDLFRELNTGGYMVTGSIENAAKGSTYQLDENSSEVKANPALLGTTRTRERATAVVERSTFLNLFATEGTRQIQANASKYGSKLADMLKSFNSVPTAAAAPTTVAEPAANILIPTENENAAQAGGGQGDGNEAQGANQGTTTTEPTVNGKKASKP